MIQVGARVGYPDVPKVYGDLRITKMLLFSPFADTGDSYILVKSFLMSCRLRELHSIPATDSIRLEEQAGISPQYFAPPMQGVCAKQDPEFVPLCRSPVQNSRAWAESLQIEALTKYEHLLENATSSQLLMPKANAESRY